MRSAVGIPVVHGGEDVKVPDCRIVGDGTRGVRCNKANGCGSPAGKTALVKDLAHAGQMANRVTRLRDE